MAINSAAVFHPTRDFLIFSAAVGLPLNLVRFCIMVRPVAFFTFILLIFSAIIGFTMKRLHRQGAHLKATFATPITGPLNCLIADLLMVLVVLFRTSHMKDIVKELLGDFVSSSSQPCPHCHGQVDSHSDHDEEQALMTPSAGSDEHIHEGGAGPSTVWTR
ncbi:hypothetical protein HYE67_007998 [Fusarium culmorum]|uniref:Uncharacterized protein n=1 Tax=Fusarium culmorum TaxID=5516 RepID=A0A7S8DBX9_FUSCU|nr:hypothetical protein HYE67_007998 [Fusarium culmorum]